MIHASSTTLRPVRDTISNGVRSVTIGLWVLTGLTFLLDALLPGIGRFSTLAPWLLAASVAWTAMIPAHGQRARAHPSLVLFLLGCALAFAISFTVIRDGDRRSLLFVGFIGLTVLLFSQQKKPAPRT